MSGWASRDGLIDTAIGHREDDRDMAQHRQGAVLFTDCWGLKKEVAQSDGVELRLVQEDMENYKANLPRSPDFAN